jgi:hypothetical protein
MVDSPKKTLSCRLIAGCGGCRDKGGVAVELIICVPIMLFLLVAAVVIGAGMNDKQNALFITRNLASSASRECRQPGLWYSLDSLHDSTPLSTCVSTLVQNYFRQAKRAYPGVKLILSVYRNTGGAVSRIQIAGWEPGVAEAGQGYDPDTSSYFSTNYSAARFPTTAGELITLDPVVFTAEAYVPMHLENLANFSGFIGVEHGHHYVSSVY